MLEWSQWRTEAFGEERGQSYSHCLSPYISPLSLSLSSSAYPTTIRPYCPTSLLLCPWHSCQKSAPKTGTINRHERKYSLPKTDTRKIRYQIAYQMRQKPVPVFRYRFSAPISVTCVIGISYVLLRSGSMGYNFSGAKGCSRIGYTSCPLNS